MEHEINNGAFFKQRAFAAITAARFSPSITTVFKSVFELYNKHIAAVIVTADLRRSCNKSNILSGRCTDKLDTCLRSNSFQRLISVRTKTERESYHA